jgi:hypothetical protein
MQLSLLYVQYPPFIQPLLSDANAAKCSEACLHITSTLNSTSIISRILILASSLLAGLELVQVPATDIQASLVLVHALPEVTNLGLACAIGALSVVGSLLLVLLSEVGRLSLLGSGFGGRATGEETANGVANGGADCYTTAQIVSLLLRQYGDANMLQSFTYARFWRIGVTIGGTYAAVEAICPKRPGPWL